MPTEESKTKLPKSIGAKPVVRKKVASVATTTPPHASTSRPAGGHSVNLNGEVTPGRRPASGDHRNPSATRSSTPLDPRMLELGDMLPERLLRLAQELELDPIPQRRDQLTLQILSRLAESASQTVGVGILDIAQDGYGFLRSLNGSKTSHDLYVSRFTVRKFKLRQCDLIAGVVSPPRGGGKYHSVEQPLLINGYASSEKTARPHFSQLGSTYPDRLIKLENKPSELSTRLIDLIAPIGRGQRALIVAPPKAGKTVLLKQIAAAIRANYPDIHIVVALIGERPEEVTDIRRNIDGELHHSTFDEPVEDHTHTAEIALERARRLVELGEDVVILLDSLTRLARAYNIAVPSSGKTLSGGMDPYALYPPKRFFGAARNCEHGGGSLTIIATVLVDTGSRLDDLIYEEFKGTGNMELHLNRALAERRLFPALDIQRSGTRHEELLLDEKTLSKVWLLRRMASMITQNGHPSEATEKIVEIMRKTKTNAQFLDAVTAPRGRG